MKINPYPKEEDEQMALATYLDTRHFLWCHVPNEGMFKPAYMQKRSRLGVKKGIPDVLIFDPIYSDEVGGLRYFGMAIELKRQKGGVATLEQGHWLYQLEDKGWKVFLAHGKKEAVDEIEKVYGK